MGGRRVADIRWAIFRRRSSNFGASRFTVRKALKQLVQLDLWSFCTECGSTEPSSTGRRRRLPRNEQYNEIKGSRSTVEKDVPAGTMAVVRSPDFLRALRETALATLIHRRRLTPSCGGRFKTAYWGACTNKPHAPESHGRTGYRCTRPRWSRDGLAALKRLWLSRCWQGSASPPAEQPSHNQGRRPINTGLLGPRAREASPLVRPVYARIF